MTIGNYGSMEISNKESLKLFLKIYFGLWHYRFNYNNYKKNVYPLLLNNKYSDNDTKAETDIDNLNIDSIVLETKVDNNLILWELKTVKSQIKNINAYLKQGGYRGNFNLENKTHKDAFKKFLKTLNEIDTKIKGEVYLQEVISNSDEKWQVFFLNVLLKDYLKIESFLINKIRLKKQKIENRKEPKKTNIEFVPFDLMFEEPQNANLSLDKLRDVYPKLLTDDYKYLKGVKGIFPMFIESLKSCGLIKHYTDMQYKDALNKKISNLNLSKDASEFRKEYQTVTDSNRTDLKLSLSQISQQGKTGK